MPNLPLVSIVIPNQDGCAYLENCLRSLLAQSYAKMEIVIVDNASRDRSVEIARAMAPQAVLLEQKRNLGFAGGANAGIRVSRGDWVAVLNNDTEVAMDWLLECVRAILNYPDAGFLACRILNFSKRRHIYSAGDCILRAGIGYRRGQDQQDRVHYREECEIFAASGCAALYHRQALEELGGYDERFFAYLEDVDLGLRLRAAGYRGYYVPRAEVYHHGAATSGGEFSPLAVRLRTRNSLFVLIKSIPASILLRCLPMIFLAQLWWLMRAAAHKRLPQYARGVAEALRFAPAMLGDRARLRPYWRKSRARLWQEILKSESLARRDFAPAPEEPVSLFLKWYFRLF